MEELQTQLIHPSAVSPKTKCRHVFTSGCYASKRARQTDRQCQRSMSFLALVLTAPSKCRPGQHFAYKIPAVIHQSPVIKEFPEQPTTSHQQQRLWSRKMMRLSQHLSQDKIYIYVLGWNEATIYDRIIQQKLHLHGSQLENWLCLQLVRQIFVMNLGWNKSIICMFLTLHACVNSDPLELMDIYWHNVISKGVQPKDMIWRSTAVLLQLFFHQFRKNHTVLNQDMHETLE